jgi:hypothetical protein
MHTLFLAAHAHISTWIMTTLKWAGPGCYTVTNQISLVSDSGRAALVAAIKRA